jgi:hypothetical protein
MGDAVDAWIEHVEQAYGHYPMLGVVTFNDEEKTYAIGTADALITTRFASLGDLFRYVYKTNMEFEVNFKFKDVNTVIALEQSRYDVLYNLWRHGYETGKLENNDAWQPTHLFIENDTEYMCLGNIKFKEQRGESWRSIVVYKNKEGRVFATSPNRWTDRFSLIDPKPFPRLDNSEA